MSNKKLNVADQATMRTAEEAKQATSSVAAGAARVRKAGETYNPADFYHAAPAAAEDTRKVDLSVAEVAGAKEILEALFAEYSYPESLRRSLSNAILPAVEEIAVKKEKAIIDGLEEARKASERLNSALSEKLSKMISPEEIERSKKLWSEVYPHVDSFVHTFFAIAKGETPEGVTVITNTDYLSRIREFNLDKMTIISGMGKFTIDAHATAGNRQKKAIDRLIMNPSNKAFAKDAGRAWARSTDSQGRELVIPFIPGEENADEGAESNRKKAEAIDAIFASASADDQKIHQDFLSSSFISPDKFYGVDGDHGFWSLLPWSSMQGASKISEYVRMCIPAGCSLAIREEFGRPVSRDYKAALSAESGNTREVTQADRDRWNHEDTMKERSSENGKIDPIGDLINTKVALYCVLADRAGINVESEFRDPDRVNGVTMNDIDVAIKGFIVDHLNGEHPSEYIKYIRDDGVLTDAEVRNFSNHSMFGTVSMFLKDFYDEPNEAIAEIFGLGDMKEWIEYLSWLDEINSDEAQQNRADYFGKLEGIKSYCDDEHTVVAIDGAFRPIGLYAENKFGIQMDGATFMSIDAYKASLEAPNEEYAKRYQNGGDLSSIGARIALSNDQGEAGDKYRSERVSIPLAKAQRAVVNAFVQKAKCDHLFASGVAATENLIFDFIKEDQYSALEYDLIVKAVSAVINSGYWNIKPIVKVGGEPLSYDEIAAISNPTAKSFEKLPGASKEAERSAPTVTPVAAAPVEAKFCPECGTPVQAGHKFCCNCGSKLQ